MKLRTIVFALFAAVAVTISVSCTGQRLFSGLDDLNGVEITYVSPALMKLARLSPGSGGNLRKSATSLEVVEISSKSAKEARKKVMAVVDSLKLEALIEQVDEDEKVRILVKPGAKEDTFTKLVVVDDDKEDGLTILVMDGEFTLKDIYSQYPMTF